MPAITRSDMLGFDTVTLVMNLSEYKALSDAFLIASEGIDNEYVRRLEREFDRFNDAGYPIAMLKTRSRNNTK